jgi:hypothetical protein
LENLWLNTNIIYHFTATAESTIFVIGFWIAAGCWQLYSDWLQIPES